MFTERPLKRPTERNVNLYKLCCSLNVKIYLTLLPKWLGKQFSSLYIYIFGVFAKSHRKSLLSTFVTSKKVALKGTEGEEEVLAHMIVYAWSLSCHFRSIFARAFVSQLHDGLGKLHLKVTSPFTFLQNSAQMGNNKWRASAVWIHVLDNLSAGRRVFIWFRWGNIAQEARTNEGWTWRNVWAQVQTLRHPGRSQSPSHTGN